MARRFWDIEDGAILTEDEMRYWWEVDKSENDNASETFGEYISACHPMNNGSVVELPERCVFEPFFVGNDGEYWGRFEERSVGYWHEFYFDAYDAENWEEAKATMEKQARDTFGENAVINWEVLG